MFVEDNPLIAFRATIDDGYLGSEELGRLQVFEIGGASSRPCNGDIPKTRELGDAGSSFPSRLKKNILDYKIHIKLLNIIYIRYPNNPQMKANFCPYNKDVKNRC